MMTVCRYRDEEPLIKSRDEFYRKDNSRQICKFPHLRIYSLSFLLLQNSRLDSIKVQFEEVNEDVLTETHTL
jgi:hypothetical protein